VIGRLALHCLAALVVVQALYVLAGVGVDRLGSSGLQRLDVELALAIHALTAPALTAVFLTFTAVGYGEVNTVLTVGLGWLIARRRSPLLGAALVLVMLGAWALEFVTKDVVQRARPELFRLAPAGGYSFPSGHALGSTCLYGALAYLLWPMATRDWQRLGLAALAVAMPLGIGLSRVYLGVHYPTDVLGGWVGGLIWLAACRRALRLTA
jgi:undecaprenyl-diphosphatase